MLKSRENPGKKFQPGPSFSKPIPVLYQDHELLIVNKPAGLLVIPSPKGEINTLVDIVNFQYAKDGNYQLHPCHRLDRDTSGVMIFAKGKRPQQLMMDLFKQHQVKKLYVAFVYGRLSQVQGEFRSGVNSLEERRYAKEDFEGAMSITRYKVLEFKKGFTIVEVEPETGRTNQIRVHFSQNGHPLVGERKYAVRKEQPFNFRRVALHAARVEFCQPVTKETVLINLGLPNDMEVLREQR